MFVIVTDKWATIKTYGTRDEAGMDVFDYIERFYNSKRKALDDRVSEPYEFERKAGFA
jgi:putative transposase